MKIAFVMHVYVQPVHCGELVKRVIWEEHILQVLSTAPAPCPWKVVLNPSVLGLIWWNRDQGLLLPEVGLSQGTICFSPRSYPAAL